MNFIQLLMHMEIRNDKMMMIMVMMTEWKLNENYVRMLPPQSLPSGQPQQIHPPKTGVCVYVCMCKWVYSSS